MAFAVVIEVAERHGVSIEDMRRPGRAGRRVLARQEAMHRLVRCRRYSLPQIGRFLDRHHATVLHGIRAYRRRNGLADPQG